MILVELLHASAKRVELEYSSMVRRRACWAPAVMLSASSNTMILCLPGGSVTFFWANILIFSRTTEMPLPLSPPTWCVRWPWMRRVGSRPLQPTRTDHQTH